MKKLILVLVIVLLSSFNMVSVYASDSVSLFFANGMFNDYNKARSYLNVLEKKLKAELPSDTDIKFFLSYNQQELENLTGIPAIDWVATGIGQLFTAAVQQQTDILDSFWNMMEGIEIAPDWFQEKMKELSSSTNELLYVVDADLQKHIEKYEEELVEERKVIIVSQSQGNFYANSAYGYMSPENLTIVAVGSPASFVAGNGEYTTSTNDVIVNAIRLINPLTLSANVTNSTSSEWTNHTFTKSYLDGDVSGPRIIGHILDAIGYEPTCTDTDGDGYSVEGGICGEQDCNDNNYYINPGAVEVCDGIDNDCDGIIDEGCSVDVGILFEEDFESYSIGAWPSANWTDVQYVVGRSGGIAQDPSDATNQVLRIDGGSASCYRSIARRYFDLNDDDFYISFKIYISGGRGYTYDCTYIGAQVRLGGTIITFDDYNDIMQCRYCNGGILSSYHDNQWYDVRIRHRLSGNILTLDYWLDGTYIGQATDQVDDAPHYTYIDLEVENGTVALFDDISIAQQ